MMMTQKVFNSDRQYNKTLKGYRYKMSVVYGTRNPLPTGSYSSPLDEDDDGQRPAGFNPLNPNGDPTLIPSSSPTPSTSSLAPTTPDNRPSSPLKEIRTGATKGSHARMKPIPKPQRQVVKNRDGKFICTWPDCSANVKEFSRKCEWSKHMDKHERPYKCQAIGCENIPGFTYSGGLLRHEREVHRKHGGPKNPLYCPHKNCKRHKDSSFARLENLNEHLRRCHTSNGMEPATRSEEPDLELDIPSRPVQTELTPLPVTHSPKIGTKRKTDDHDLREENKRLRFENQELRRKIEAGYLQQGAMMEQIDLLEKEKATLINQLEDTNPIS
ncbi:hypothetical protein HD806DRAFT_489916 [Xylariaceae sp. AK1471]|nr:hypothetical protein HD806DRAFT_489916 [Xylariaceae sp. AK1471]